MAFDLPALWASHSITTIGLLDDHTTTWTLFACRCNNRKSGFFILPVQGLLMLRASFGAVVRISRTDTRTSIAGLADDRPVDSPIGWVRVARARCRRWLRELCHVGCCLSCYGTSKGSGTSEGNELTCTCRE